MGQEKQRELSTSKSHLSGWGTEHELADLHKMSVGDPLFQAIVAELPHDFGWNPEAPSNMHAIL